MFDLEQAIHSWKRSLRRSSAFEEGQVTEMETHLRAEIDRLAGLGRSEKEAFEQAVEKFGAVEDLGVEVYKTKTVKQDATPPWKQQSWIPNLIPNYLKMIWRNYRQHRGMTLLNLGGLSLGIACFLAIVLYLRFETNYESSIADADRIYRITYEARIQDNVNHTARSAPPIAPVLDREYPEVEQAGRLVMNLFGGRDMTTSVTVEEQQFQEEHIYFADPSIPELFSLDLLKGDLQKGLRRPNAIVLSEHLADKYFGDRDPIGEVVRFQDDTELEVTGVYRSLPRNTHLRLNALISMGTFSKDYRNRLDNGWFWIPAYSYIKLADRASIHTLEDKLPDFYQQFMPEIRERFDATIHFQPIREIHLGSKLQAEMSLNSDRNVIYLFGTISLFILLIAAINYMNLSTARYSLRTGEVGVRKAMGASKMLLARQFLFESVFTAFISLIPAMIILYLILPVISAAAKVPLDISMLANAEMWVLLLPVILLIGLLAGSYPAFFLSGFEPSHLFSGRTLPAPGSAVPRKILVTTQFGLAIALIAATFIALQQLDYMQDRPLGFEPQNLAALALPKPVMDNQVDRLKQELASLPEVKEIAYAESIPGDTPARTTFNLDGQDGSVTRLLPYISADQDFVPVMNLTMAAGRNFRPEDRGSAEKAYIINETAADKWGWKQPIGKVIRRGQLGDGTYQITGRVVGVVEDFHIRSLHEPIEPLILSFADHSSSVLETGYLTFRLSGGGPASSIEKIREVWETHTGGLPFNYLFVSPYFNRQYDGESRLSELAGYASLVAICIACLGLFGLATYTTERRRKEVGVRKILGAGITDILRLLSREFVPFILVGGCIAIPLSLLVMSKWLNEFAYHIEIGPVPFIWAGLLALVIAITTISGLLYKVAVRNPVESLRDG